MRVDFCLTIKNAIIADRQIDYFQLSWCEDLTPLQLAGRFNRWLYDDDFLSRTLPDLHHAGVCTLSINPL